MGRKKKVRIPKTAKIKCPFCEKMSRIDLPNDSLYSFECKKCKQKLNIPQSRCCIICAYSDKKCVPQLLREAKSNNLEIKSENPQIIIG